MSRVTELWQRIEDILGRQGPERIKGLNAAASAPEIQELERVLNTSLPEDFKESLLRHDGQDWLDAGILGGAWELLSSRKSMTLAEMYRGFMLDEDLKDHFTAPADDLKDRSRIKNIMWNTKWFPIADNSGQMFLLDLDPETKGDYGQVISYFKSEGPYSVVAKSFTAWFAKYVVRHEKRYMKQHEPLKKNDTPHQAREGTL